MKPGHNFLPQNQNLISEDSEESSSDYDERVEGDENENGDMRVDDSRKSVSSNQEEQVV